MSFEHAPVTKGLIIFLAVTSTVGGIFDIKHYLHLQLVPHLSTHHQYWRLLVHQLACASSSDLLVTELVLYNAAVNVERGFGSVKYASFLLIALGLNTIGTMLALLILKPIAIIGPLTNNVPAGPTAMIFSILFQYFRLVPEAYQFKVFGVSLSDKFWIYGTASQLTMGQPPATLLTTAVGLICGYVYRSDMMQLKGWRIPHSVIVFGNRWLMPMLGQETPPRRTNRVIPEAVIDRESAITTARHSSRLPNTATTQPAGPAPQEQLTTREDAPHPNPRGVVRQWVSELTDAANPSGGSDVRVPSDAEIQMLTSMFPGVGRDVLLGVLQRSSDVEAAVETMLGASRPQI